MGPLTQWTTLVFYLGCPALSLKPYGCYLNDATGRVPQAGPVGRGRESTSRLPTKATVTTFLLSPVHHKHSLRASPFQFRNVYQAIYEVVTVSHNCRLPLPFISFMVLI